MTEPNTEPAPPTWRSIAVAFPDFVEWIVQTYGPRHDGVVSEVEYTEMRRLYLTRFSEP